MGKMKSLARLCYKTGLVLLLLGPVITPLCVSAQKEKPVYRYYYSDQEKAQNVADRQYKLLPPSVFLLFNAGVQGDCAPKQFFAYRNPSFGLKVGTMRNTGWFVGFMTNFNFEGALNTFTSNVETVKKSNSYFDFTLGLTGRYFKPVTFLFGVGPFYQALKYKTSDNEWGHYKKDVKYGPMVSAGFMFHIFKLALSIEMTANYDLAPENRTEKIQADHFGVGFRAGIGFCLARNKHKSYALSNTYRDNLEGYGKELRKQTPMSFTPSSNSKSNSFELRPLVAPAESGDSNENTVPEENGDSIEKNTPAEGVAPDETPAPENND